MTRQGALPSGGQKMGGELGARLLFVLLAILVYRIGAHIPVPGINPDSLASMFDGQRDTILGMFNMFSGGALERMSIFALGIMPYISAAIIMQLLTVVSPYIEQLKKEGEAGRRKMTQLTRYGTLVLAIVQSMAISVGLAGQGIAFTDAAGNVPWNFYFVGMVTLTGGTMFMMWLGEQITERGVGNGISLLIFAGIVSALPSAIGQSFEAARQGDMNILLLLGITIFAIAIVTVIVFLERGQRKITINYAKRQQGRKVFAAQTSHLPLKINMAGVIPAIFASSLLIFPASLGTWFGESDNLGWLQDATVYISPGQPLYYLMFAAAVIFFCYFYTAITFNPKDVAENLKRSGAFVPGIRPGEQTARYVDGVSSRLTLFGASYIAIVSLVPQGIVQAAGAPFIFGGTSILIVVVVVMDFMSQVQSHLMSQQYSSVMKKANLQGYRR
ncbi:preprotein translocase subunit SecY [Natronospirillum operosum]|uniref:Protein translocase subunit SecY n=1 Tax=Natronospirillum operosum TaxID=2759953 RepID=A0A4Z0W1B8_9GAMM|nr:preprotein translocase subunit SecY [Natronospirillum operosum]TGG90188.1 preprotein translocase subunit SecY [Natronospirillum operosum]